MDQNTQPKVKLCVQKFKYVYLIYVIVANLWKSTISNLSRNPRNPNMIIIS